MTLPISPPWHKNSSLLRGVRENCFPYCLVMQADGRWVFLNKSYNPIGFCTGEFINYDDYPIAVRLKGFGPQLRKNLDARGDGTGGCIYLYNDSCIPDATTANMRAYLQKLQSLMRLDTEAL